MTADGPGPPGGAARPEGHAGSLRWILEAIALAAAVTAVLALRADELPRYAALAAGTVALAGLAAALCERGRRRVLPVLVALGTVAAFLRAVARPVTDAAGEGFAAPGLVRAPEAVAAGMEWVGEPFRGAPAATATFVALAGPLVLPGVLGGASAAARAVALRGAPAVSGPAAAALGVAPVLVLLRGVNDLLLGAEALLRAGLVAVLLSALAGALAGRGRPCAAGRLAALVGGAAGLALGGAGAATPASTDAAWMGLVALGIAGAALAGATPGLVRASRRARSAPLARAQPTTFLLFGVVAVGLAGLPPLLPYVARSRALGAIAGEDLGREALALMLLQAPLLGALALPLVHGLFLRTAGPAQEGAPGPGRDAPLRAIALGAAAAALVALGVAPEVLEAMAPEGGAASPGLPGPLAQVELLGGGALAAMLLAPVLARRARTR